MNYVLSDGKEQISLIDAVYPIGAYYITESETSPAELFGGQWELLEDKMLIGAGNKYAVKNTGGGESVTLETKNLPAHSHTRGTMDITGWFYIAKAGYWGNGSAADGSVFSVTQYGQGNNSTRQDNYGTKVTLKASNNWTGATSSVGNSESFSIMNPYRAVYIWRRIQPTA